jgi:purine-binding chemotaxis protein CheW
LPLGHVLEIMRALPLTPIATAPRYVRGLSIIRGKPLPVVDLGMLLDEQPSLTTRLVSVMTGGRSLALAVESVEGVRAIGREMMDELPPLLRDGASDMISSIGTADAELLLLLLAWRLVPDAVFELLRTEAAL